MSHDNIYLEFCIGEPAMQSAGSKINDTYMRTRGPLLLVEDDQDDQDLMIHVLRELGLQNEIITFRSGVEALRYLQATSEQPFLILSDINMPGMDGITFKKKIDASDELRKKCIPFIFISTSPAPFVKQICELSVQGFFEKGNTFIQLQETMMAIFVYWNKTKHLN